MTSRDGTFLMTPDQHKAARTNCGSRRTRRRRNWRTRTINWRRPSRAVQLS
jgi:hypothetical protein